MDLQAQDRVHRIGQTRPVIIYRLVTNGTVEKKILDRAANKRKLEKLVIHKCNTSKLTYIHLLILFFFLQPSLKEIRGITNPKTK